MSMIVKPGMSIFNKTMTIEGLNKPIREGTVGGFVYDNSTNTPLIITCFHSVMDKDQSLSWAGDNLSNHDNCTAMTRTNGTIIEIGRIIRAIRSDILDVAVIKPNQEINPDFKLHRPGQVNGMLFSSDLNKRFYVWKYGLKTMYRRGEFEGIVSHLNIEYPNQQYHSMKGLLRIKSLDQRKKFSDKGDSGSLIYDFANNVVGIVVAGNTEYSYAFRASYISYHLKIKFNI